MRFTGTVEYLGPVDVEAMLDWIVDIPFSRWPQQHPVDGRLRPAMVNDTRWEGFGLYTPGLSAQLLSLLPEAVMAHGHMLSVVMPNDGIDTHADTQSPQWLCRVHCPLTTNLDATMTFHDGAHHLEVGAAYKVNTESAHSIWNGGSTPRIHFMTDLFRG